MSDIKRVDPNTRRRMRAMIWATRLHTGPLAPRELRALELWRAAPENQRALDASNALWRQVEGLRPQPEARVQLRGVTSVLKFAACVTALIVGIGLGVHTWIHVLGTTIETEAGEWRTVRLNDATVLRLGPSTLIQARLNEQQRRIRLIRGEALFVVAKDPSRPFLAETDGVTAQALGTKFAMTSRKGASVITVEEGVVLVYRTESKQNDSIELSADLEVTIDQDGSMVTRKVNAGETLAWADGWLALRNGTVADVVEAFNRRHRVQIRIEDAAVAAEKVSYGHIRLDDPESFADWLKSSGNVVLVRERPNQWLLTPRAAATGNSSEPHGDNG